MTGQDSAEGATNDAELDKVLGDIHSLSAEEFVALGSFIQQWLFLEDAINTAFSLVFNLDPYKRLCITTNMMINAKINALRAAINLVENNHQRGVNAELNSVLSQIETLNKLRNKIVHNSISGQIGVKEERLLMRSSARGKLKREVELIDVAGLGNSAGECRSLAEKLASLTRTYAISYDRFELHEISMLGSTKYDQELLDKSARQMIERQGTSEA